MTTTARSTPVGTSLDDGFSTKIALASDPDISFWEKSVKPLGLQGGDPIDITTMFNVQWRTFALRQLLQGTPVSGSAAYDPAVLDQILAIISVNGWFTIHHPNGDTWDVVGGLQTFEPQENQEGSHPVANFVFFPTMTLAGVETAPVHTNAAT